MAAALRDDDISFVTFKFPKSVRVVHVNPDLSFAVSIRWAGRKPFRFHKDPRDVILSRMRFTPISHQVSRT